MSAHAAELEFPATRHITVHVVDTDGQALPFPRVEVAPLAQRVLAAQTTRLAELDKRLDACGQKLKAQPVACEAPRKVITYDEFCAAMSGHGTMTPGEFCQATKAIARGAALEVTWPDVDEPHGDDRRIRDAVDKARAVIEQELPAYWPRVEAILAASATLRLKHLDNCTTLLLVGPPSSGKSSAIDMLRDGVNTIIVDRVTPAAFVANTMGKTEAELKEIDLLTKIQHQVMLTREMGTVLRGSPEYLAELFKVLTNVLDGKGYAPATATQGRRAITGDYVFVWIGGTTPIPQRTWDIQAELGSRLMFYDLGNHVEATDEDILLQRQGKPFKQKIETCSEAVKTVLVTLFLQRDDELKNTVSNAVRSVEWGRDSDDVTLWLVRLGRLLAHGRWRRSLIVTDESSPEDPHRNVALLENLARGRAMLHGRRTLNLSDILLPAHVVLSSMPNGRLIRAVAKHQPYGLTVADAARECGCTAPTAQARMNTLVENKDLVEWGDWKGPARLGRPVENVMHPTEKWKWLGELAWWL